METKPVTREEIFLNAVSSGETTSLEPKTREEMFLAKLGGADIAVPQPITRKEQFLKKAINSSGGNDDGMIRGITDFSYFCYGGARLDIVPNVDTSNGTNFANMFESCNSMKSHPNIDTRNGTNFSRMFGNCSKLTTISDLNTSNGTTFYQMFYFCQALSTISDLNTSNGTNFRQMFDNCVMLSSVSNLDLNKATSLDSMFKTCKVLENLQLYNIRKAITIGSGTSYGHLLTVDSLVHTIKELCKPSSGTLTLSMGATNTAKLADVYCKVIDDTTEKIEMELCESTDEGAMTIIDYAALKSWTIQ